MDRSFLLRQKNIDTFQDSNCLFGIASMECLKGGDRGEKYTKEGEGPFYSPQSPPSLSNIYTQWFSYNTQSES